MARRELRHQLRHHLAGPLRALNQSILFVDGDRRQRRRARKRVAAVREAARKHLVVEEIRDLPPNPDGAERDIRARNPLRHRHDVGNDLPVIDGEPLARSSKAGHHFVGNHHDAVLVAERAHTLHVAIRWNEDAVGARHRFDDDRRNRLRPFEHDQLVEIPHRDRRGILLAINAVIPVGEMNHAGQRRLAPAARLAGGRHRSGSRAVIRPVSRQNLVAPRVGTRDLERVLVGLRAPIGKEEGVDIARGDLGKLCAQLRARLGRHAARHHVAELRGLCLDGLDHPRIAVADVHRHQLAVEVDVALPVRRVEVDAFRSIDGKRIDGALYRPFGDRVLLRERNHLFARHLRSGGSAFGGTRPTYGCCAHRDALLMNDPDPARPTNLPPSITTRPREMTVSVAPTTSRPSYGL